MKISCIKKDLNFDNCKLNKIKIENQHLIKRDLIK